ncbi:peroxiredoxin [Paralimibaculum aggregatum]|uniref:Glutathione-dependent peroxiredoxin n=1 Tax=Paralimibaculum aggregatum TaxID=3036245 RepID=A0ABQ6LKZ1_9RHOB|nr:peroxiredoxin [Limibaculum sp. NKW23]GMG81066.1 peroxiredoxin [Limibaculum sp. NKW23]
MIETGQKLPEATLLEMTAEGPGQVTTAELFGGKTVALFAVPGAFTPTCSNTHVPSFVNGMDALKARGVDAVVCLSVNDPFVMGAWGAATGASEAGIRMVGDPAGGFVKAMGLDFSADVVGLVGRAKRFAALVEDGTVKVLKIEDNPGEAGNTSAEALMAAMAG